MSKRFFDVVLVAGSAFLWVPVLSICAGLVALRLGRPVFFIQERPGFRGRPFNLVKLRSMRSATDEDGKELPDSERMTSFGSWLRSTSMDELPELWNVLKGEMSLVGPRPLLTRYIERYSERQRKRMDVLPGITGWSQVNGRNAVSWAKRLEDDVWYVENRSFLLDLKILVMTIGKVARRDGITAPNQATMDEFMGND